MDRKRLMPQGIAKNTCDVLRMLSAFHSVVVEVRDFTAALEHYTALLGREAAWIGANETRGCRSALFPLANMTLEIRDPAAGDQTQEGLAGMRLSMQDDGAAAETLEARGISTLERCHEAAEGLDGVSRREWTRLRIAPTSSRGIPIELTSEEQGWPLPAASRVDDAQSAVHGLDHVVVFSADVESTRAFYAEGLGIRLALDRSFENRGVRLLFFRLAGVTIELGGRLGAEVEPERPDRFGGLAWQVDDVRAIQTRLAGRGFDVSALREGHKAGTRVCSVRNWVHGVPTLLIEPVSR